MKLEAVADRGQDVLAALGQVIVGKAPVLRQILAGILAFALAYFVRFETSLTSIAPLTKGHPPFRQYLSLLPFIGLLIPAAFHLQGLYRLRRGRTRVDDFFAVLVGSIVAV